MLKTMVVEKKNFMALCLSKWPQKSEILHFPFAYYAKGLTNFYGVKVCMGVIEGVDSENYLFKAHHSGRSAVKSEKSGFFGVEKSIFLNFSEIYPRN